MRKAIIKKFVSVLLLAMGVSGFLFYFTAGIAIQALPAILLSLTVAFIVAYISAERLAKKLIKPLYHIVDVMDGYKDSSPEVNFEITPYEEVNKIAEAALVMSDSLNIFMKKVEFEQLIRQEFFENASHELKTPITSIRGYMELLLGGFVKDEEQQRDFMNRILDETEHISTLINEILLISQLETNEVEVAKSEIRIAIIVEDVIRSFQLLALENDIRLFTECKPVVIIANYKHIRELLSNLIGNAIKYNRPKGEVHITVETEGAVLVIIVEDTGVGIAQEAQARVFERFYRVDKGRSRRVGGTGLGLSIVKHIANYYQGSISLQSKLNQGSTFTCRLQCIKNV